RDGSSLATLFARCAEVSARSPRAGYVLVVRDSSGRAGGGGGGDGTPGSSTTTTTATSPGGSLFGAYLTDPPHPASHFYGTGECFLWKATSFATNPVSRSASPMLRALAAQQAGSAGGGGGDVGSDGGDAASRASSRARAEALEAANLPPPPSADTSGMTGRNTSILSPSHTSGTETPTRIRFKAFPYSGVNDYMMFCETGFLSVGGG
ncbi:oxidation resistance protein 1, partial [Ascosphaera atra]